jgi:hypothetical protein
MEFDVADWRPVKRGGIWVGDGECIEMMQAVDAMPKAWRALVYEYGGLIVRQLCEDGFSAFDAETILEQRREKRQAELLAQDHITERVIEGFKQGFRRAARPPNRRRRQLLAHAA